MQVKIYLNDLTLKHELRKSLIFLFPKKTNEIFKIINNIKTSCYIIIINNEIYIQFKPILDENLLYLSVNSFVNIIKIIKKINKNTPVIRTYENINYLNNKFSSFNINNIFSEYYGMYNNDTKFLVICDNIINIITLAVYEEFFIKFNIIDLSEYLRINKLKNILNEN